MPPSEHRLPSTVHRQLVAYFRSGWAFLIPYLAAYLLYAWLDLPVNPAGAGSIENGAGRWIPCLLHMYWLFHALHLVLGAIALRSWLRQSSLLPSPFSLLPKAAPWFFLMLLFWIPGVYMEFPADPWQHYARVNEWSWLQTVTEHSYWKKSSYFLAYSFIGKIAPPLLQLKWFDVYYTACCLLLCWQYYRLARAIGLSERISLLFVLINVLTFGNNIFGFYRYYGMSSTLFAQLGAVALTRVALEAMRGRQEQGARSMVQDTKYKLPLSSLLPAPCSLLPLSASALALLALTALNHVQGVGIAAIGITAVIVWRLVAWRKSMVIWLGLAALLLSVATVQWYPRHPLIDSLYRPNGWMSPWYGFPVLQPGTPGFDRAWVIIGAFGGLNLLAGLWLVLHNRIEGWLTLMPVLLLSLPVVAIPFASVLAGSTEVSEGGYVMAYHRMLFAIPCGLAACALIGRALERVPGGSTGAIPPHPSSQIKPGFAIMVGSLAFFTLLPAGGPALNRMYNGLMIPADDLAMRHVLASAKAMELRNNVLAAPSASRLAEVSIENSRLLANPAVIYVLSACGAVYAPNAEKNLVSHLAISATQYAEIVRTHGRTEPTLLFPAVAVSFSTLSSTASLSGHWLPNSVALDHSAEPQMATLPVGSPRPTKIWIQWLSPRDNVWLYPKGAGQNFVTPPMEDRGRLDSNQGNQPMQTGDQIVLRPVMRSDDRNGVLLYCRIAGPGTSIIKKILPRHDALGGPQWTFQDIPITLKEPGRYEIEVTGIILGNKEPWIVRHHLIVKEADTMGIQ